MLIDVESANSTKPADILLSDYPKLSPPQLTTSIAITPTRDTSAAAAPTMPRFTDNYADKWHSTRPLAPETITKGLKELTNNATNLAGQGEEKVKKTTRLFPAGSFIGGMVVVIIIIVMATFGALYKGLGSRNYSYLLREEGFSL